VLPASGRLGQIGQLQRGKSKHRPRNDTRLFLDGKYPFIQTGDVARSKKTNYLISTVNNYYNDFGLAQSKMFKKGTLCITIAANIAECGFLNIDACVPDSIVCFSTEYDVIKTYIFYIILFFQKNIQAFAPATAQKNINLGILNDILVPLPPLQEQKRIVEKVKMLFQQIDELSTENNKQQKVVEQLNYSFVE
jgi:type I restriction enzyme S subunit